MNIWPYTVEVKKELEKKGLWRPLLGPQALYIHLMGSSPRFREGFLVVLEDQERLRPVLLWVLIDCKTLTTGG